MGLSNTGVFLVLFIYPKRSSAEYSNIFTLEKNSVLMNKKSKHAQKKYT